MKLTLWIGLCLGCGSAAIAQTAPPAGVASEWDIRKLLDNLSQQADHLKPIIEQVHPEGWVEKGAPDAYIAQWKAGQAEVQYLLGSTAALSKEPERLTLALDTYFRMQALEGTLSSLIEGIRKYQNPALADLAQSVVVENSNNRDRLRQYLFDLAQQKEDEFRIADREAQRCRSTLLSQPAPQGKKTAHP